MASHPAEISDTARDIGSFSKTARQVYRKPVKTVFSGIQPSGDLHLGNYLGAVRNWVALQGQYERAIYCVVDYHAITQPYDAKEMPRRVEDMVVDLLALGIDPERSLLFLQ